MANLSNINNKFLVTTGGNVGINSTSPSQKLVVIGNISTSGSVLFDDNQGINFGNSNAKINGSSSDGIKFFGGGSEKMRLTQVGNVGIGTTSPDTLLHIYNPDTNWGAYSVITLGTDVEGTNQAQLKYYRGASASTESFQLSVRGTTALTALYNGNVGIGTTSPASKFEVYGGNSGVNDVDRYIRFKASNGEKRFDFYVGGTGNASSLGMYTSDGTTKNVQIASGGTSYFNGGNLGIGTTSPSKQLMLYGNTPFIRLEDNQGGSKRLDLWVDSNAVAHIDANQSTQQITFRTASTDRLRITNAGNVGIGTTSPSKKLHVKESASATYAVEIENTLAGGDYMVMIGDAGDNVFEFDSSGTGGEAQMKMYSDGVLKANIMADGNSYFNGGNVGIGTTTPTNGKFVINQNSSAASFGGNVCQLFENFNTTDGQMMSIGFRNNNSVGTTAYIDAVAYDQSIGATDIRFSTYSGSAWSSNMVTFQHTGRVGIGTTSPSKALHVVGANPTIRVEANTTNWAALEIQSADTQSTYIFMRDSGGERARIQTTSSNDLQIYTGGGGVLGIAQNSSGNVGIGMTNPSSELEVAGRAIVEKLEVARYSDVNAPEPVYAGRLANPMGAGGVFRLAAIESSSTVNKIDEPFLITYSSGHWGCQPMFFAEFTVTYYRGSYIKYWAQHEVSGSRLEIVDGPYGGQIISGGAPVSRTITQLCTNCHGGQPVYKCVWKWSNSGTYIKTSPIVSLVDGPGSTRVYTSGSSSESAIDTLLGSAGSPGPAYLLMGINNAQAAGFTGLQTQN